MKKFILLFLFTTLNPTPPNKNAIVSKGALGAALLTTFVVMISKEYPVHVILTGGAVGGYAAYKYYLTREAIYLEREKHINNLMKIFFPGQDITRCYLVYKVSALRRLDNLWQRSERFLPGALKELIEAQVLSFKEEADYLETTDEYKRQRKLYDKMKKADEVDVESTTSGLLSMLSKLVEQRG